MSITQSTNLRNTELASGTAGPAGSATFDRVALYTGAPVGAGVGQTGTLIGTFTLSGTPFAAPSAGTAALNAVSDITAAAGGTIASFLFYKSTQTNANTTTPAAGDNRLNGSVATSGGDWTIDNATVVVGQTIHVTSFTLTAPS